MPDLDTKLHIAMLKSSKRANSLPRRILRAMQRATRPYVYGQEWGDLDDVPPLAFVLQNYVKPYLNPAHTALEIGPGGGRWTWHLKGFKHLYAVEYYSDLINEFKKTYGKMNNITIVKNNGVDFPGIPENSIDFLFSFGVFVHLDRKIIDQYLANMKSIVKKGSNIVIHYSDKTKLMAMMNEGFSENTPELMRQAVISHGYKILEEDLTSMWHSSIIRFTK